MVKSVRLGQELHVTRIVGLRVEEIVQLSQAETMLALRAVPMVISDAHTVSAQYKVDIAEVGDEHTS